MCPYDAGALPISVLEEAERNHPVVTTRGGPRESAGFRPLSDVERPFDRPLPQPGGQPDVMTFGVSDLGAVRGFTRRQATHFGLRPQQVEDVVLAVDEVATNSIRYGGGQGHLRIWGSGATLISEISDAGRIDDPLVGRRRPTAHQASGFGLWAVNQLCDLVQIRVFEGGSVVRMHMSLR